MSEANWREATSKSPHFAISQSPMFVGRAVGALAQDPDVSRWRYLVEVQDAGKPAAVTGYR